MTQKHKPGKTILLYTVGWFSALFAIAGFLLPVIPGIAFLVISLTCFARCSTAFQNYIRKSAYLAKLMDDYEAGHGFIIIHKFCEVRRFANVILKGCRTARKAGERNY